MEHSESVDSVAERAAVHAALGEPVRLAIVEDLAVSDRSPKELAARFSVPSNLLAHHLDVLEDVGLIERFVSAGDRRRRYVRLVRAPLARLGVATALARRSGAVRVQSQLGAFAAGSSTVDSSYRRGGDVRRHASCRSCPSRSGRCGVASRLGPEPRRAPHAERQTHMASSS